MEHVVPSFEVFANELKDCWKEQLPFIVAVTGMNDPACETQQGVEASSSSNSNNHDNNSTTDLVLGYLYTLPLFHETGHKLRMAEQGTFIHPDLRKSGVGSRLTALNLNLIKAPERYTSPPESLARDNRVFTTSHYPELDIYNYKEFQGVRLRPVKVMVRRTVVDEEGIGRGKSRFFEKFGFREVGYVKGAGEKMGGLWDLRFWGLELVDWDEVRAMPKVEKAKL